MNDERLGVVAEQGQFGERVGSLGKAGSFDVLHSPIRVQMVHVSSQVCPAVR